MLGLSGRKESKQMKIRESKTYAWVSRENCVSREAYRPGTEIGNEPIHKHGDFAAWKHGKRETLAIIAAESGYKYQMAKKVADLMGWEYEEMPYEPWRSAAGRTTAQKLGPEGRAARAKAGAAKRWGAEWTIRIEDRSESGQSSAPILYAATRRAASPEAALVAALKALRKAGVNFRRHAGPSGDHIDPAGDSFFGLAGKCVAVVSPAAASCGN